MRIEKWIEINLTSEDIRLIFDSDKDSLPHILYELNNIACFLRDISDSKISKLSKLQRTAIKNFLIEQAERYVERSE